MTPEAAPKEVFRPHPGPQSRFLACPVEEAGYGGGAGAGKTLSLTVLPLRWTGIPEYQAIMFRRSYPELEKTLIKQSRLIYPYVGGRYNEQKHIWTFPAGGQVIMSHLEDDAAAEAHDSSEYQTVIFDEARTFTKRQYEYLHSRARSTNAAPIRIRWGSNPSDPDDREEGWLFNRYRPWLDRRPEYDGVRAAPGQPLAYLIDDNGDETQVPLGTPKSRQRTFFPARLEDNPTLMAKDPNYDARIRTLGLAEYNRLRRNDWFSSPVKGALFRQEDFDRFRVSSIEAARIHFRMIVVAVDPATTNKATSDETGIIVMGVSETDHAYLLADESGKGDPPEWARWVVTAYAKWKANYVVAEGNQGGDMVKSTIQAVNGAIPVEIVHASRGKDVRLEPLSVASESGRFHIVGKHPQFESEGRKWIPRGPDRSAWSPNRLDASAHAYAKLMPAGVLDRSPVDTTGRPASMNRENEDRMERELMERLRREQADGWGGNGGGHDRW